MLSLFFISGIHLSAASITKLEVKSDDTEKSIELTIETKGAGFVKVELWKSDEMMLSDQYEALTSFKKLIDFSNYTSGNYSLKIEDDTRIKTYSIELNATGASIDLNYAEEFKPTFMFNRDQKRITVNWMMKEECSARITTKDEEGRVIYSKKFRDGRILGKIFDFRFYKPGKYQLLVSNPDRNYQYTFEIED